MINGPSHLTTESWEVRSESRSNQETKCQHLVGSFEPSRMAGELRLTWDQNKTGSRPYRFTNGIAKQPPQPSGHKCMDIGCNDLNDREVTDLTRIYSN